MCVMMCFLLALPPFPIPLPLVPPPRPLPWYLPPAASVVNHHGQNAADGHYTADVKRGSPEQWVRIDDALISYPPASTVTNVLTDRSAYLLFYRRKQQ